MGYCAYYIYKLSVEELRPALGESIFLSRVEGSMSWVEGTMSRVIFFSIFFKENVVLLLLFN